MSASASTARRLIAPSRDVSRVQIRSLARGPDELPPYSRRRRPDGQARKTLPERGTSPKWWRARDALSRSPAGIPEAKQRSGSLTAGALTDPRLAHLHPRNSDGVGNLFALGSDDQNDRSAPCGVPGLRHLLCAAHLRAERERSRQIACRDPRDRPSCLDPRPSRTGEVEEKRLFGFRQRVTNDSNGELLRGLSGLEDDDAPSRDVICAGARRSVRGREVNTDQASARAGEPHRKAGISRSRVSFQKGQRSYRDSRRR